MNYGWWIVALVAVLLTVASMFWRRPRRQPPRTSAFAQAKRRFHTQRERLEAKFLQLAAARNTADAPRWADCLFADDVSYVRSRTTGELSAFVAVTVAVGDSEDERDTAESLQAGTAVFRFDRDHWETDGRAILNLSPGEAIQYYRDQLEIVGEEFAHHS